MRILPRCFPPTVLAAFAPALATAGPAARFLTVDDTLRVESVGQAVIANDERTLVYEWVAAHEEAPNLDSLYERGDPGPRSKLYAVDLRRTEAPRLLFPQEGHGGYWIGALSPDGRRLAVYSLVSHTLRAGVLELESGRLIWFDFTPNYHSSYMQHPTWISNDELVYVAMEPGGRPFVLGQYALAARMRELWEGTFAGKEPSVTVLTSAASGVEDPDPFEPGILLRVDARTGRAIELDKGYFASLTRSPDGRYLAALRFGGQLRATNRGFTGFTRRLRPFVFDLQNGARKLSPCDDCHVLPSNLWWSVDGRRLAFRSFHVSDETLGIHQYEPATQSLHTVDERGLWLSCWAPVIPVGSGNDVAVFAQPLADRTRTKPWIPTCIREARQDWYLKGDAAALNLTAPIDPVGETPAGLTPDGLLIVTADGEAWVLGEAGKTRRLQAARGVDSGLSLWQPFSMSAQRMGSVFPTDHVVLQTSGNVIYYDLKAMRGSSVRRPSGKASLLAMSPHHALFREDAEDGSSRLRLAGSHGTPRDLLAFNTHLRGIELGSQAHVSFEFKGEKLSACLLLPPHWSPQRRYPTLVKVYPGRPPEFSCRSSGAGSNGDQLFAANGYIVLSPPSPSNLIRTPEGPTRELPGIALAAVDAAIAHGYTDPDRLGVYGMSQGFHSALQVVTESNRFKAAVAANGIADFASHYGSVPVEMLTRPFGGSMQFSVFGNADRYEQPGDDNGLGVAPWVDPGRYTSNSPVFHADRIETPVLLLHSDFDGFGMEQATEMFSALYRLRKEAQYAIYWGEPHGNISPANVRDVWKRMLDWYGQHLGVPERTPADQATVQ